MKGPGHEGPRFCCASTEHISAGFFHPNVSQVPRATARGYADDRSPDHYQSPTDSAPSRKGPRLLVSSGVVAATLVLMGTCPHGNGVSAHLRRAEGACVLGRG